MELSDYTACDALDLTRLIRAGEVSRREVTLAAIAAIEALNPRLNAVITGDFEGALTRLPEDLESGPLAGAPFLLKDVNLYSEDFPTSFACRFFEGAAAKPDSSLVKRWRHAGLTILGKTNTPEFAQNLTTEPAFTGTTHNPWDLSVTTGGSSGGAAAAVASGMVPLAHGTDLGGSIRVPAACCGVFGFKPSVGLNPLGPHLHEIACGLDSDHVISRTVRDSAACLDATAGPDAGSRFPIARPVSSFLEYLEDDLPRLRIGVATEAPGGQIPVGPDQRRAVEETAIALEERGHFLEPYRFPASFEIGSWCELLWMPDVAQLVAERSEELGRLPERHELEALTWLVLEKVEEMPAGELHGARHRANQAAVALAESMAGLDILLTPALARDPLPLGTLDTNADPFDYDAWEAACHAFAPFSSPFNITGQPAAACPVRVSAEGLPMAAQIVGHSGQDHLVLRLARQLEEAFDWGAGHPPVWAGNL